MRVICEKNERKNSLKIDARHWVENHYSFVFQNRCKKSKISIPKADCFGCFGFIVNRNKKNLFNQSMDSQ